MFAKEIKVKQHGVDMADRFGLHPDGVRLLLDSLLVRKK
jgi:hypothetical protein